jgi:hypothetical protein
MFNPKYIRQSGRFLGADFGGQETRTSVGLSSTGAHASAEINPKGTGTGSSF